MIYFSFNLNTSLHASCLDILSFHWKTITRLPMKTKLNYFGDLLCILYLLQWRDEAQPCFLISVKDCDRAVGRALTIVFSTWNGSVWHNYVSAGLLPLFSQMEMLLVVGQLAGGLVLVHFFYLFIFSLKQDTHTHTHTWNRSAVKLLEARRSLSLLHILPEGSTGQLAHILYSAHWHTHTQI